LPHILSGIDDGACFVVSNYMTRTGIGSVERSTRHCADICGSGSSGGPSVQCTGVMLLDRTSAPLYFEPADYIDELVALHLTQPTVERLRATLARTHRCQFLIVQAVIECGCDMRNTNVIHGLTSKKNARVRPVGGVLVVDSAGGSPYLKYTVYTTSQPLHLCAKLVARLNQLCDRREYGLVAIVADHAAEKNTATHRNGASSLWRVPILQLFFQVVSNEDDSSIEATDDLVAGFQLAKLAHPTHGDDVLTSNDANIFVEELLTAIV